MACSYPTLMFHLRRSRYWGGNPIENSRYYTLCAGSAVLCLAGVQPASLPLVAVIHQQTITNVP